MRPTKALPLLIAVAVVTLIVGGTNARADDEPPSTPTGLVAHAYGPYSGGIRWERSHDDRGDVVGYQIARDGIVFGIQDTLSHVDHRLVPNTVHRFEVTAIDSAGQRSGTARVLLTTPDAVPPAPLGLRAAIYSSTALGLAWWRPSSPVFRHEIRRDGRVVEVTDGTSHIAYDLMPGRTYLFEVIALNRQGQRSPAAQLALRTDEEQAPAEHVATPVRIEAVAIREPHGKVRTFEPTPPVLMHERGPEKIVGVSGSGDGARVALLYSGVKDDMWSQELVELDPAAGTSRSLGSWNEHDIAISQNATIAALMTFCRARVQLIGSMSAPIDIDGLLSEDACAGSPRTSADGSIVLFRIGPRGTRSAGDIRFTGADPDRFSDVVHDPAEGTIFSVARDDLPLGDPALDSLHRLMTFIGASDDGRRLLYLADLVSDIDGERNERGDYSVATLVVDTRERTVTLLGKNDYHGRLPSRNGLSREPSERDAAVISGDGRIVYYLQSSGRAVLDLPSSPFSTPLPRIVRVALDSGERVTLAVDGVKDALATDADGGRLAYRRSVRVDLPSFLSRDQHLVVHDVDANTLVNLSETIRFCDEDGCLFESYSLNPPFLFAADGSALLVNGLGIPTSGDTSAADGTQSLVYDTVAQALRRSVLPAMATPSGTEQTAISDDGETIIFIGRPQSLRDEDVEIAVVHVLERGASSDKRLSLPNTRY